jgi:hypothetical protein
VHLISQIFRDLAAFLSPEDRVMPPSFNLSFLPDREIDLPIQHWELMGALTIHAKASDAPLISKHAGGFCFHCFRPQQSPKVVMDGLSFCSDESNSLNKSGMRN